VPHAFAIQVVEDTSVKLPKQATGVRYLNSTDYTTRVYFVQPNMGNGADGAPLPPAVVYSTYANIALWRAKQVEKEAILQGQASYKITIRYPRHVNIDTGMQIKVRDQLHNIDSFLDPDGRRREMLFYTWIGNDASGRQVAGA
jgi:head-tail adaptor